MMDDIAEQQDVAKEISDAISKPVAFDTDIDDEELEKELEELEQEELNKKLLDFDDPSKLPAVPTDDLATKDKPTKGMFFSFNVTKFLYRQWDELFNNSFF